MNEHSAIKMIIRRQFYKYRNDDEFMKTAVLHKAEKIAVFCHEDTIRCDLKLARDADAYKRPLKNHGVYLFEYSNSVWQFKTEANVISPECNTFVKKEV